MQVNDIVAVLERRLEECKNLQKVQIPSHDEFELGVDCRLDSEIRWLEDLLEQIYRAYSIYNI